MTAAEHLRDLLACKTGSGFCNDSLLNPSELKDVTEAKRQRNALACEAGEISCDRSLLDPDEAKRTTGKPLS